MIPPAQAGPHDRLEAPQEPEVITLGRRGRSKRKYPQLGAPTTTAAIVSSGAQNGLICAGD
jgi:hypothetical protein